MLISGNFVVRWLELLGGFSVLLQCLEYARITASTDPHGVWAWQVQRADIPDRPVWLKQALDWLYQPMVYRCQLTVRALAALALMLVGNHLAIAILLFASNVLLLIRWRGAFNGGSDFMTLIVLTGADIGPWRQMLLDTDVHIAVPHERAARVAETQLLVLHSLCDAVDLQLMGEQESL